MAHEGVLGQNKEEEKRRKRGREGKRETKKDCGEKEKQKLLCFKYVEREAIQSACALYFHVFKLLHHKRDIIKHTEVSG